MTKLEMSSAHIETTTSSLLSSNTNTTNNSINSNNNRININQQSAAIKSSTSSSTTSSSSASTTSSTSSPNLFKKSNNSIKKLPINNDIISNLSATIQNNHHHNHHVNESIDINYSLKKKDSNEINKQQQHQQYQVKSSLAGPMHSYLSSNNNNKNSNNNESTNHFNDVKVQVYYCGIIMVVYIRDNLTLDELVDLLRDICKFDRQQLFTIKWVDEEGDPCTLSSQLELDEALRLYYLNKESELLVHIFANIPDRPGTQCAGEDRSIYRRGARRWRKIYMVNGHKYQAKRFARTALCKVCQDRIWGLGRQGYKCLDCKTMVHKRCHKFISLQCSEILMHQQQHQHQQHQHQMANNSINNVTAQQQSHQLINEDEASKQAQKHKQALRHPQLAPATLISTNTIANNSLTPAANNTNNISTSSNSPVLKNKSNDTSFNKFGFNNKSSKSLNGTTKNNNNNNNNNNNIDRSNNNKKLNGHSNFTNSSNSKVLNEIPINELEVNDAREIIDNSVTKISPTKIPNNQIKTSNSNSNRQIGLDQFDLIKVIGRGSYAKVFLVEYRKTRKCYAMKVIKKSIVDDDEDIDWVQTEKHVFEQATNHPFLVGLHSCFQTESRLFFVIEYLCGGDLMYHMQRKRRLPEDHARFYSAEISVALGFLHSKGIIYRDLKLDNVLLDIEGHVKLTDYGMCKEGLSRTERTSTFCGTPNYIAPEMLRGEDYDFSVDWWALGVLLYEMMAGRSPFEPVNENPGDNPDLNTEDHLFQVILEKPIRIPRSLSVRAASVLKGFLQKTPSERLASHDGLNEIKQHLFFKPIDWNLLEQRQIQPPYKPPVQSERDLTNIDELFTREPVILTPDTPNTLSRIQQNEFDGFEYINPLILSDEIPV